MSGSELVSFLKCSPPCMTFNLLYIRLIKTNDAVPTFTNHFYFLLPFQPSPFLPPLPGELEDGALHGPQELLALFGATGREGGLLLGGGDVEEVEGEGFEFVLVQAVEAQGLGRRGGRKGRERGKGESLLHASVCCLCGSQRKRE